MKRIFLALVTIMASASLAFASTAAAWTSTVSATNIQVITGSTQLSISTNETTPNWSTTTNASPFTISGLIPGPIQHGGYVFSIGDLTSPTGIIGLTGKIVSPTFTTGTPDPTKLWIQVYDRSNTSVVSSWATLAQWETGGIALNPNLDVTNSYQKNFGLNVQLDPTAANEWQGQTVKFTMEVTGTQQ